MCCFGVFVMVTHRIKIHLTLPLLRVGAGLLDAFFFSVLVPLTVLDFYLEPIFQQNVSLCPWPIPTCLKLVSWCLQVQRWESGGILC